jgi:hypothetical protein
MKLRLGVSLGLELSLASAPERGGQVVLNRAVAL